MSKRTIRDWMLHAFTARDKASFTKVADEAEEDLQNQNGENGNGEHKEPDGDEGDDNRSVHVHVHQHGAGGDNGNGDAAPAKDAKDADETETRLKGCEDGIAALRQDIKAMRDALPPEFLKKKGDGDDDDKNDDAMPEELKEHFEGKDEGIPPDEGSSPSRNENTEIPPSDEQGTLEAKAMPEGGDAELLDPSGALHTGKSNMGDKKYTGDDAKRVNAAMAKLLRESVARAEMLTPGVRIPSFDAVPAEGVQKSYEQLCTFRRNVLVQATTTDKGRHAVGRYTADAVKRMSCDAIKMLFIDSTDRARATNNARTYEAPSYDDKRTYHNAQQARLHAINEANREFWNKQTGSVRH